MSLQLDITHSGHLAILLPSGLKVTVPADTIGMSLIIELLQAQMKDDYQVIGTKASPIQYVVDKFILSGGKVTQASPSGPRRARVEKIVDGVYKVKKVVKQDTISLADLLSEEG